MAETTNEEWKNSEKGVKFLFLLLAIGVLLIATSFELTNTILVPNCCVSVDGKALQILCYLLIISSKAFCEQNRLEHVSSEID